MEGRRGDEELLRRADTYHWYLSGSLCPHNSGSPVCRAADVGLRSVGSGAYIGAYPAEFGLDLSQSSSTIKVVPEGRSGRTTSEKEGSSLVEHISKQRWPEFVKVDRLRGKRRRRVDARSPALPGRRRDGFHRHPQTPAPEPGSPSVRK